MNAADLELDLEVVRGGIRHRDAVRKAERFRRVMRTRGGKEREGRAAGADGPAAQEWRNVRTQRLQVHGWVCTQS